MAKKNMLIITDASGEIIGAQVEENSKDGGNKTFILPAEPEHTLHRVYDVPAEIYNLADPAEFHAAMTRHFNSEHAKVKRTSAEELGIYSIMSRLGPEQKKAAKHSP
ncbi:MAG: hypothetical protein ACXVBF_10920 [Flavisolibacter sp.]|jgi:hypothetical protein